MAQRQKPEVPQELSQSQVKYPQYDPLPKYALRQHPTHANIRPIGNAREYEQQFRHPIHVTPQELKPVGSANMHLPFLEIKASLIIMPSTPMFLNKPTSDDKKVTYNFDNDFDGDLEAILYSFFKVMSNLLVEYKVAGPPQYFDDDYFEYVEEQIVEVEEQPKPINTELFDKSTKEMRMHL